MCYPLENLWHWWIYPGVVLVPWEVGKLVLVVYDQIENELVIKEWRLRRSVLNFPYKLRRDDFQLCICMYWYIFVGYAKIY